MIRVGCPACGAVFYTSDRDGEYDDFTYCARGQRVELVALPTAADVLAFRLRMTGRGEEAERVADDVAVLQEHRRGDQG